jgi:hypothetical protein
METENLRAVKEVKYQIFNDEEEIATLKIDEEEYISLEVGMVKKYEFLEILTLCKKIIK